MKRFLKLPLYVCLIIVLSIFLNNVPLVAQEEQHDDSAFPPKMKSKETWENILNVPGTILAFPFWLLEESISPALDLVLEKKLVAKVKDFLKTDDGLRGVYPTYESQIGGGIKLFQKDLLNQGSKLDLIATVGLRWRQYYQIHLKRVKLSRSLTSAFSVHYLNFTDEPFFEIGNNNDIDSKSNYAHKQASAEITIGADLPFKSYLTTNIGFDYNRIRDGRNNTIPSTKDRSALEKELIPGLTDEVRMFRLQATFEHDSRNRLGNPSAGWLTTIKGGFFSEFGEDKYGFWQANVYITRFFHLFRNRTFLIRGAAQITEAFDNRQIPFYYMSELGERETIRGYSRGRFRDEDMVLGSLEYRYPILNRARYSSVDFSLFVDTGKVYKDLVNDFDTSNYHFGYGGGFRFYTPEGTFLQFLVGFSEDGYRFYLVLN
jgi:hypothetical protein